MGFHFNNAQYIMTVFSTSCKLKLSTPGQFIFQMDHNYIRLIHVLNNLLWGKESHPQKIIKKPRANTVKNYIIHRTQCNSSYK